MAALSGGETCIKYLMFAFNLVFWVSPKQENIFILVCILPVFLRVCVRVGV